MKFIASTILFFFAFLTFMTTALELSSAAPEDATKTTASEGGGLRGRALFNMFRICSMECYMYHRCHCQHDYPYCADYEDHRYNCN